MGPRGNVYSIEANPTLAARLRQAAARNAGRVGRWEVIEHALSEHCGEEIEFHLSHHGMWSSAMPLGDHEAPSTVIKVTTASFDTLAERFGKVRLLKIDIEGSEGRAFRGAAGWLASANAPDYIISECNDPVLRRFGSSAGELLATVAAHGYRPHQMFWRSARRPGFKPLEGSDWAAANCDVLFVREGVS